MKNISDEENGFELVDYKETVQIERSHILSKRIPSGTSPEENDFNPAHWNDKGRKQWTILLFFGCLLVYATRTSISICAVPMGKELGWDKQLSVTCC